MVLIGPKGERTLGIILGEPGGGHQVERLSWPTVQGNPWYEQGGLLSPTLFNVVVDSAVRHWILLKMEDKVVRGAGIIKLAGLEEERTKP